MRHLADNGYSISEIADRLDYPIPKEKIAEMIWEYYVNIGKICLQKPEETHEKVSFIKEQDSFGKISFRRVAELVDNSNRKYIKCDFGKELYKNTDEFSMWLQQLETGDREYIESLPWPLNPVYHEFDGRMKRISQNQVDVKWIETD